jgi:non-specific serine/threonine protein kinase
LDVLQSLVDKSLLRHTDERFWMLETIREYAAERVEESGEIDDLGRRHGQYYLTLAEEAEPSILGADPVEWLDRLERDHDNLRAALDRLESCGEPELAMQLGGTIWEFWCLRGHAVEGWRRLENLLSLDERQTLARAKALAGSAHLAVQAGASGAASRHRAEEALRLHRELGNAWDIACSEYEVAMVYTHDGDFAAARPLVEESMRRLREVGDEHRALQATRNLAWCYLELDDIEHAKPLYEEALAGARAAGDRQMEPRALNSLASVAIKEGRARDAITLIEEAYRLDREFGDPSEVATDLVYFARSLAMAEGARAAAQVLSRSELLREELGITYPAWILRMQEDAMSRTRAQLTGAAFAEAWEQGRKLTADEAVALALDAAAEPAGPARAGSQAPLSTTARATPRERP